MNLIHRCAWFGLLAAAALSGCSRPEADRAAVSNEPKPEVLKASGVQIASVGQVTLQGQLRVPGEVVENNYGTTLITPRVPALVVRRQAKLGDEVATGDPLVTLSSVEVADAQAGLAIAEQEWKRMQALGRDLVSGRRYGEAQISVEQARAKARAYGLPGTAHGRANGEFTLTAPHAGRLTQDEFVVGEQVEPGHPLFRLVDESRVWVDAKLPAQAARQVMLDGGAQIQFGDALLAGKVLQRGHHTAEDTRTAPIRIEVANVGDRLHAGDLVEVLLTRTGTSAAQLAIPNDALTLLGGQTVAFRQNTSGALEPVPVETGETVGRWTVVRAGLKVGDRIAVAGVYALKSQLLRSQLGEDD